MSQNVQLPALGESVTEGTVTRWLKSVGDAVAVDEPLLEISTDKVDTEIPSPFAGVLEQILVGEDETAQVGAVLAVIGDGTGAASDEPAAAPVAATPAAEAPTDAPAPSPAYEQPAPAYEAPAAEPEPAPVPVAATPAEPATGTEVLLPALGESVTEGTVTRWLKSVGDSIEVDEPLLEISTDKVDTEVPSPVAGVVQQILVGEDETAQVGAVLAIVGSDVPVPAAAPAPAPVPAPAPAQAASAPVPAAAAVAAVMTSTPLGRTGRNTSSSTERATMAYIHGPASSDPMLSHTTVPP